MQTALSLQAAASNAVTSASNLINLQSLIDLSAALNASDDDTFILNTVLLSVMGKLRVLKSAAFVPVSAHSQPSFAGQSGQPTTAWKCLANKGLRLTTHEITLTNGWQSAQHLEGVEIIQPIAGSALAHSARAALSANDAGLDNTRWLALLCLGTKLNKQPYTDEERQYLSLVASIAANALLNAENVRSLRETGAFLERKNQLLTTLFEINREFSSLLDKEEILKFLSLRLMGQLTVTKFALLIKNTQRQRFELVLNRLQITCDDVAVLNARYEELVHHNQNITALQHECSHLIPSCTLLAPMTVQNEVKGLLLVGAKMNRQPFRAEEGQFLEALASTAMTALENARLFHEEIEKKRLEEELSLARHIQKGLLPTTLPVLQGFEIAALNNSSKQIGGDYYDVIAVDAHSEFAADGSGIADEQEYIIVIADVSGKGTPAALLMANTQAALRVLSPLRLSMPEMVSRLNDMLYTNTASDKFVTLFCCKLNPRQRTLTYVNAGHNPPMLLRADGTLELLTEGGLVLGIMETIMPYAEKTIDLRPNDVLLMYTDGVSEALNHASEEFSEERTEQALRQGRNGSTERWSAQSVLHTILQRVEEHVAGAPQSDDITMIVLRCLQTTTEYITTETRHD
jgi:sigma-B regulation protein RsbU (phosphoserine phosphatase)